MADIIHNEPIKLFAGLCNGLAVAFVAAGVLTPAAVLLYGTGVQPSNFTGSGVFAICVGFAVFIHLAGQALLNRLKEADDD